MDVLVPVCLTLMMFELLSEVYSSMWQNDISDQNIEFQSYFFKSAVRLLGECIWISSSFPHCVFATFSSSTRECKMYSILEGPVRVTNTSLWKAQLHCVVVENGPAFIVFDKYEASFDQAKHTCVYIGGRLAITDKYEEQLLSHLSHYGGKIRGWIGGVTSANGFKWIDGRVLNVSEKPWVPNNPSGNGECLLIKIVDDGYYYDDGRCNVKRNFICECDHLCCGLK